MTSVCKRRHIGRQVLIDVDDFIEGGKETHRKAMESFYEKGTGVANLLILGLLLDKGGHCSPAGGSCHIAIIVSLYP